jgi:hypothetical protein
MTNPKRYGMTLTDIEVLLAYQRYRCATCNRAFTARRPYHIDHNHRTGKVRGLLCGWCNRLLGHIHEDVGLVRRISVYLTDPPADTVFHQPRRVPDAPPEAFIDEKGET